MLDSVRAIRYIKTMESGRNAPLLLQAERSTGETLEVVVKPASSECGTGGLIREALASMLAADLGLPVAEPFLVWTEDDFITSVVPAAVRARFSSAVPAFGCALANGMSQYSSAVPFSATLTTQAGNAFAFDGGILNADRLLTKPNCLTDGTTLLLIDHELSLNVAGRGFLAIDPWVTNALAPMTSGQTEHLFFKRIKGEQLAVHDMLQTLGEISTARIDEYQSAIPVEWDGDAVLSGIVGYLEDLVTNASELSLKVEDVLA